MNRTLRYASMLLVVLMMPALSGCLSPSSDFRALRNNVLNSLDATVTEEQSFGIGPGTMWLSKRVISFAAGKDADAAAAKEMLRHVKKLDVSVCALDGATDFPPKLGILRGLDTTLSQRGLEPLIRHAEPNEIAVIYVAMDKRDRLNELLIVSVDASELSMVRIKGRLDTLLAEAMKHGERDFEVLEGLAEM